MVRALSRTPDPFVPQDAGNRSNAARCPAMNSHFSGSERGLARLVLFGLAFWSAVATANAAIVMVSPPVPNRFVVAAATNPTPPFGTVTSGPSSSTLFGSFGELVTVDHEGPKSGPLGSSFAQAAQTSSTPPVVIDLIFGAGRATVRAAWEPPTGGSGFSGGADSFFDVHFEVSLPGIYFLGGSVDFVSVNPVGSGASNFAQVRLINTNTATDLLLERSDFPDAGPDAFGASLSLAPGITYRLIAEANVNVSIPFVGAHDATARWDFRLAPETTTGAVPEPSSFVLLAGIGLLLPTVTQRRKRK
jgi:PEP-CTERM motif